MKEQIYKEKLEVDKMLQKTRDLAYDLNVVLFIGRLEPLDYFMARFIEYFQTNGINHYIVDVRKPETFSCPEFDSFISRENVCVLVFNNVGVRLTANGENIWKLKGIPVFTHIQDHPRYFADLLLQPECDLYALSLDENHIDFIRKYYPAVKDVFFIPNGGTQTGIVKEYKDRNIDVLYMGNCQPNILHYPIVPVIENRVGGG